MRSIGFMRTVRMQGDFTSKHTGVAYTLSFSFIVRHSFHNTKSQPNNRSKTIVVLSNFVSSPQKRLEQRRVREQKVREFQRFVSRAHSTHVSCAYETLPSSHFGSLLFCVSRGKKNARNKAQFEVHAFLFFFQGALNTSYHTFAFI